ncbi:hypothetical protein HRbin32_00410 [bacterium HR32]|nr:hypothetical protein HRbin32_00410 [bacterium HR32]
MVTLNGLAVPGPVTGAKVTGTATSKQRSPARLFRNLLAALPEDPHRRAQPGAAPSVTIRPTIPQNAPSVSTRRPAVSGPTRDTGGGSNPAVSRKPTAQARPAVRAGITQAENPPLSPRREFTYETVTVGGRELVRETSDDGVVRWFAKTGDDPTEWELLEAHAPYEGTDMSAVLRGAMIMGEDPVPYLRMNDSDPDPRRSQRDGSTAGNGQVGVVRSGKENGLACGTELPDHLASPNRCGGTTMNYGPVGPNSGLSSGDLLSGSVIPHTIPRNWPLGPRGRPAIFAFWLATQPPDRKPSWADLQASPARHRADNPQIFGASPVRQHEDRVRSAPPPGASPGDPYPATGEPTYWYPPGAGARRAIEESVWGPDLSRYGGPIPAQAFMIRPPIEGVVTAVLGDPANHAARDAWLELYHELLRRYVSL